jgi:predicted RNA-binding Zn-ribbon protein involved in translation (DUF1610 family)
MTTLDNKIKQKLSNIYYCEKCDYKTERKSNMVNHENSMKHKKTTQNNEIKQIISKTYICENCGKIYNDRAGLWRHKKKCVLEEQYNENTILEEKEENTVLEKDESKDALIQYLISENKEFKNLILEFVKKDSIVNSNNTITHTNSHNKTFNLQFFLNETCKDAMNMSDFINSLTLQLSDLENVGKLGFVDGISNIIIKNLESLDVEKRPVHCCDAKRETMYIKDNDKWEKEDNELKQMRELVRYVRDKNISMVNTWRDMYPECVKSDSKKTTQYNKIYMEAFGGETGGEKGTKLEKEEKIISRIAKSVIIDKA